jgi:hypothetical protein
MVSAFLRNKVYNFIFLFHKPDEPEPNKKKCPTDESCQRILIWSFVGRFYPLEKFMLSSLFGFFFFLSVLPPLQSAPSGPSIVA